jgi:hypothetical protein
MNGNMIAIFTAQENGKAQRNLRAGRPVLLLDLSGQFKILSRPFLPCGG